ncbi:MAG: class I SAM-dependent RNA methyltransferase [Brevundimonas sp.]|jgi:23S rRNA (uracil1939-C5)-methyltransferase|uniref:class I SAM-dependent RNA methyltransferase n=1 Tax=Brevundimonas sp. TaxID=1871086 RepID=UPI00391C7370
MEQALTIRSVGHKGDGVAQVPSGDAVHVPLTLPGERVLAEVRDGRASLRQVIEPSPDRVAPVSPHYGACGGCVLQHWRAEPYLAWKRDQVIRALAREGLECEVHPVIATGPASRRRVGLHARRDRGGQVVLGFKGRRSWSVVPVERCPIMVPAIERALPALAEVARPFLGHPKSAPILHVTATLTGLDVDVTGVMRGRAGLSADQIMQAGEAAGRADLARLTMDGETLYQVRDPMVQAGRARVVLPPGGFTQAVEQAERAMVETMMAATGDGGRMADLFCGLGTFSFPLAERGPVLAMDGSAPAIEALRRAQASAPGLKPIRAEARDLFLHPLSAGEMKGIDTVVFDPPRAGALAQAREIGLSGASRIVGISCNPATFARDAAEIVSHGWRLDDVQPVDQFLWSAHIELVGTFSRK